MRGADHCLGGTALEAHKVRCREIGEADLAFRRRPPDARLFRPFARLLDAGPVAPGSARGCRSGYPRFGYMLDHDGMPVGVLLLLYFAASRCDGELAIHCNLSSWYVEPAFRNYASMLTKIAQRHKEVTYFNVSAAALDLADHRGPGIHTYCRAVRFGPGAVARRAGSKVEVI